MNNQQQRIIAMDVLRGFALLGILLMNIQSFSMPSATYLNPMAYGNFDGVNQLVWVASHLLADQKFMSLFSMLFGAGVLLFCHRLESQGKTSANLHFRRMTWLLLFGLLHGYLFWYGDILFSYALCGMLVFLFRKRSVRFLLISAFLLMAVANFSSLATGWLIPYMSAEDIAGINQSWQPPLADINQELKIFTSDWLTRLEHRAEETFFMQTYVFLNTFLWRATGMMCLGMALFKSGFFHLNWQHTSYIKLALVTSLPGAALVVFGLKQNFAAGFSLEYSMFIGSQYNYWGSVLLALTYASLFMLLVKFQWFKGLQQRLAAIGKTAFSNYILHTLLATLIFNSFGLFGQLSRVEQLLLVLAIWGLQLLVSPLWLKHFKMGPLEWLWRCLTYARWQSIKVAK